MLKLRIPMFCLAAALLWTASGCGSLRVTDAPIVDQQSKQGVSDKLVNDCVVVGNQGEENQRFSRSPIRMAVFQDKSGSANTTRTEQLTEQDFVSPIKLLRCNGGELAVGIVDDVSNGSL